MKSISFEIPGKPVGKARPRVVQGHAFTPQATASYENLVKVMYKEATDVYFDGDVKVQITAFFDIPKSYPKKKRGTAKWYNHKPDWDNIGKIICDSLNGVAWADDASVVRAVVEKRYTQSAPFVNVTISEVTE